ncbi:MAG: exodeoxyribonuclease III [Candidatus Thorarchaeota archaeon]
MSLNKFLGIEKKGIPIINKIISWNVNGIKSSINQGLESFIKKENPDCFCFQESKSYDKKIDGLFPKYFSYWNPAERKGYSGTVIYTKKKPLKVFKGMNIPEHDKEGRMITLEFDDFYLTNVYTVNSQRGLVRLEYRMVWDQAFLEFIKKLDAIKPVIICGDLNVAHKEIDIANPELNAKTAGFTVKERSGFTKFLENGFVDTFREFNKEPNNYTYWDSRTFAREKNIGWRIDYFLVSRRFLPKVKTSRILNEVYGSDHCPIILELKV